jgi:microcystin-dependent protein
MEGWAICNGQNNTPNLQERFIVGANVSGSPYSLGSIGGEVTHTLTINEMPHHTHRFSRQMDDKSSYDKFGGHGNVVRTALHNTHDEREHLSIQGEGGGQPHENRPPYYALFYIIKL